MRHPLSGSVRQKIEAINRHYQESNFSRGLLQVSFWEEYRGRSQRGAGGDKAQNSTFTDRFSAAPFVPFRTADEL